MEGHRIRMRLTNGQSWLTKPYDFPCKFIPIIPVWGNIEISTVPIIGPVWCALAKTNSAYITYTAPP
ncbi:hypothetical protein [Xylella fastidiosa]|uniref:hypothetical protein n=1 Tax=Xylella fastidiosa TaxID=2371 RepID=UPI0040386E6C